MDTPPFRPEWPNVSGDKPPVQPPWGFPASLYPPGPPTPAPPTGSRPESTPGSGGWRRTAVALCLVALLVGAVGFGAGRLTDRTATGAAPSSSVALRSVTTATSAPPPLTGREIEPAAAVAKALGPAVVQIETGSGLGSGFIYDRSGLILTAAHVVNGTKQVRVRLADGTRLQGSVLGADDSTDVAVVRVKGSKTLPVAALATGVKVEVGQTAVAIGSPFGLNSTVTAGIVSAVGRSVDTPGGAIPMVQTDAPINPGNSGGALADRRGRVIGINDSIAGQSGGNVGVGLAVPIDIARSVADRIIAGKSLAAGFLGVETLSSTGARSGAQLSSVTSKSPAAQAGLRPNDVVTAIDGEKIDSQIDLVARIRSREPGQRVEITFVRGGQERTVSLTLAKASS